MACKGFIQALLKILNFVMMLAGLAMVGYGVYMLITYKSTSSDSASLSTLAVDSYQTYPILPFSSKLQVQVQEQIIGVEEAVVESEEQRKYWDRGNLTPRLRTNIFSHLPTAWFIYVFTGVGAVIFLVTCSGYIAAAKANGCCLSCYTFFVGVVILGELAIAGFVYFDKQWEEKVPDDSTGKLANIESFVKKHLGILKWVALGVLSLQVFLMMLSIILRMMGPRSSTDYESDDEDHIPIRRPLLNRPTVASGTTLLVQEPRNPWMDSWSARMREKYGIDTTNFTRRPSLQTVTVVEEPRSRCTVM